MRLDHPIFQGPLTPDIEWTEAVVPGNYRSYPEGRDLPEKIQGWKVHEGEFPAIDVGLVSDPYGFEDSPDCEWISSGINSKGPLSMALGRQGNLFLWGFYGDPSRMTPSAQRVFLNTIVYMKRFDGAPILIGEAKNARDYALIYAGMATTLKDSKGVMDWLKDRFPANLWESTGGDGDKLEEFYRAHLEFLYSTERGFAVDPDLMALNVSNRRPEFFERVLERLDADPQDASARRLLTRYAPQASRLDPTALRKWLEENRQRLFFTDTGGFQWRIAPPAAIRAPTPAQETPAAPGQR
jgi:hypothetical protein